MLGLTRTGLRRFRAFEASGAGAPENHLRLVDEEPLTVRRTQAGPFPHHAGDIDRLPARTANEVVVVVSDARFVEGGRSGWLDPPEDPLFHEGAECVVYRLL